MSTPHLYRIPTLILLLVLTISCTPQISPALPGSPTIDVPPTALPATLTAVSILPTQKPPRGTQAPGKKQGQGQGSDASQNMDFAIPEHAFDVILGRPTDTSVLLSLLAYDDQTVTISYGTQQEMLGTKTVVLPANRPTEVTLENLSPDTLYVYTINNDFKGAFHTARAPGSTFTFTVQADSHLDSNASATVYQQTLANQRADTPDFVIDLGDTFMTDKYKPYTDAEPQYLAQRYFLGQLGVPLYLVLGNHDGEGAPKGQNGMEISAWAAELRTSLFPNPVPGDFYSGNTTPHPAVGDLQNYYAWEWGDALFIVLDPYWFTPAIQGKTTDLWNPTLGDAQYQWLKTTLEHSDARWKFVFIHQLVGGLEKDGRGGVEVAPFHEWGGLNVDGSNGFAVNRPGWDMPVHPLLLAHNVSAVFHGHDHLFVHQELDGIVYQEVPQPASASPNNVHSAADYGYLGGAILGGPGYMRVTVSPEEVNVEYVRSYVEEKPGQQNKQVDYMYSLTAK